MFEKIVIVTDLDEVGTEESFIEKMVTVQVVLAHIAVQGRMKE